MFRTYADLSSAASAPGQRLFAGAFDPRHLRAVELATIGACGEGPMWAMGVTLGFSIMPSSLLLRRARRVREAPQAAP